MPPDTESLLCRTLVDGHLPEGVTSRQIDEIWALGTFASVDEMLAAIVRADATVSEQARARATARLYDASAREVLRFREIHRVLDAFDKVAVPSLLMKGAGLAYTVYADPRFRPASDIDLLIAQEHLAAADAALVAAGYRRHAEPEFLVASTQGHYSRPDGVAVEHDVDLHWRISNRHAVAHAIAFAQAWAASEPVARLGPSARTLGLVDALLLACIHRVAHHDDHPDLRWIWDIHALATRMTAEQTEMLVRRADETGTRALVAHGLALARSKFQTPLPSSLLPRLEIGAAEPSALLLTGRTRPVDLLRSDLAATPSWRARLHLLREHLFPGLDYMRVRYPGWPGPLMPLAYPYRIVRGAPKWFRRPPSPAGYGHADDGPIGQADVALRDDELSRPKP